MQTGGIKGNVEGGRRWITRGEEGDGVGGGIRILGLHEDKGHGRFGPVSFEEDRQRAVKMAQQGVGCEGMLQFDKEGTKFWCPD